jgi:hypothetical protein
MRGRYPSGPEFVLKLHGSDLAKKRALVLLETLRGKCRVQEACARLELSEQRLDQIRIDGLQGFVDALEPRPSGRPAKVLTPAEIAVQQLQARIAQLEADLRAALIRAELAVTLPQAREVEAKKASRSSGRKHRRPPARKRL